MKSRKRHYAMTGRAAKAESTRARIRATAAALFCEGPAESFTLEEVADRAGVAVRTILRAFPSKDELIYAALEDMAAGGVFLRPVVAGNIKAAVSAFFDIYESVGDFVIQRLAEERRRPALKASLDQGRDNHRDGVKTVFAPYLERLRGSERAQLLTMLIAITDVYLWKLLRRDMGLGRATAEGVMRKIIESVIGREQANGTDPLAELVGRRQPAA